MARTRRRRVTGRHPRDAGRRLGPGLHHRLGGVLTVQLLPHYLRAGELPRAAVGDEIETAPTIYAGGAEPAGRGRADGCGVDELGAAYLCGTVLTAPLLADDDCWVDVLDTSGWLLPLNWGPVPALTGRVRIEGALYLEPALSPGTPDGDAVSLCRERFLVEAVRRYRRTSAAPVDRVDLDGFPSPDEASDAAVVVADLRPRPA